AEERVRTVLAQHPCEKTISLLAISVSNLEERPELQLVLPLGLADESRRPGSKRGMARRGADRAVDTIRDRFGWDAELSLAHCWPSHGRSASRLLSSSCCCSSPGLSHTVRSSPGCWSLVWSRACWNSGPTGCTWF